MGYSLHKIALMRPPLPHQRIARNIVINYFNRNSFVKYEAFQDGMAVPDDPDSHVPDVVFIENSSNKVRLVIEIVDNKNFSEKYVAYLVETLTEQKNIKEVFLYNCEQKIWQSYGADIDERNPAYSKLLKIDFSEYTML